MLTRSAPPFDIYLAQRMAVFLLSALLLYALLRSRFSPLAAWLTVFYASLLPGGFINDYVVHFFATIPLLAALLAAQSGRRSAPGWVIAALALAALVRPEFSLALVLVLLALLVGEFRAGIGPHLGRRLAGAYWPALLAALAAVVVLVRIAPATHSPELYQDRSWGAFVQHYALGYQERHPEWVGNPWTDWSEPVRQSFGEADSLANALRRNPREFGAHMLWNLGLWPKTLSGALAPIAPWANVFPLAALLGFALIAARRFRSRRDQPARSRRAHANRQPIWCRRGGPPGGMGRVWFVLGAIVLGSVVSSTIIRPREIYLIALTPAFALIVAAGLQALAGSLARARPAWLLPAAILALLAAAPMPLNHDGERRVLSIVSVLEGSTPPEHFGLFAESAIAFCEYTDPRACQPYEIYDVPAATPFDQFLVASDIRILIANPWLSGQLSEAAVADLDRLRQESSAGGWKPLGQVGDAEVYLRSE